MLALTAVGGDGAPDSPSLCPFLALWRLSQARESRRDVSPGPFLSATLTLCFVESLVHSHSGVPGLLCLWVVPAPGATLRLRPSGAPSAAPLSALQGGPLPCGPVSSGRGPLWC